jgi:hypothetical protein
MKLSLPIIVPEVLQAKRRSVIKAMKTDRSHSRGAAEIFAEISAKEREGIDFWEAVRQAIKPTSESPSLAAATTDAEQSLPFIAATIAARRSTIPPGDKEQAMCRNIQDKELRFLVRLYKAERRERGDPFISQADMIQQWGINRDILYETDELGRRIGFTPEQDEFIGHNALGRPTVTYKRKGKLIEIPAAQFLKRITPGSETPAETKARRAKSKRPHRSRRRHKIRAEQRAITKARRAQANDVDCRQSAVSVVLTTKWVTIVQLGKDLAQSLAFRDRNRKQLVGRSLHQAILRTLRAAQLSGAIETKTRVGKFHNPILAIRRRR